MALVEPIDHDVQVRADTTSVVVVLRGHLDAPFADVLGEGLAAALAGGRCLLIDVSRFRPGDVAGLEALGRVIDIVVDAGHDVAVRGAKDPVRAYLRLRHPVSFVTQL